jgi:outer membrane protein, heavy metal efflux system
MKIFYPGAALLLLLGLSGAAQADALPQETWPQLSLTDYLRRVVSGNPDLKAARATLDVARAQINVAKVFPDPEINLGVSQYDLTRRGNPTILGTQLSLPVERGGKRRARVALAQSGVDAAGFDYADAVRALRALAANAFIDALHARLVVDQKRSSLGHLRHLVEVNQRRLAAGDIAEIELVQSRVEMQQFQADVLDAEGEEEAAETVMAQLLGNQESLRVCAGGELRAASPSLDKAELVAGIDRRGDIHAAVARVEGAQRQLDLEHAKRVVDVTVGVGWLHNLPVGGEAGLPSADMVAASVSVPVPFSRIYRGEIEAAESTQRQAQSQLLAVRVRALAELQEAFARLRAAARRVAVYDQGTLVDANAVLEKTLYSYQRGEASLVEVLIVQRTASETQLGYLDALADRAHALVAVGQAAGLAEELLVL